MKFFFDNYLKFRNNRLLNLFVVNLRYLIGLGFLPSGMIKVLDRPFTRIENEGIFFDYLDALYTTGYYYNMIGLMQVLAAVLLITQRYSTLGSVLFLPIIFNIAVLTLSTIGSFTPLIATLMLIGTIFLLLWDYYKWINIFSPDNSLLSIPAENNYPTYNRIQAWTGILLILLPSLLIAAGFPKLALASVVVVLTGGNAVSEFRHPVLRPILFKIYKKPSPETDIQKL